MANVKENVRGQERALKREDLIPEPPPLPSWDELETECLERGWDDLAATMRKAKRITSPEGLEEIERRFSRL